MYRARTMKNVVREVKILLESVWLTLVLTTVSRLVPDFLAARFSRTRSNTTIVALME